MSDELAEPAALCASVLALAATCMWALEVHRVAGREPHDLPRMAFDAVGRWADAGCPPLLPPDATHAERAASPAHDATAYWGDAMECELRRPAALPPETTPECRAAIVRMLDAARAAASLADKAPFGVGSAPVVALGVRTALGAVAYSLLEGGATSFVRAGAMGPVEAWSLVMRTYYGNGGVVQP